MIFITPVAEVGFTTTEQKQLYNNDWSRNPTVLGVCGAGRVLDPLIIFQGKKLQSTWRGNKSLPKNFYGVSEKSWMTTGIFAD